MNAPIRYFGGKGNGLSKKIIEQFPDNYEEMSYLEPFGGSGAVLFNKIESPIEIYNDLEQNVYSLYKVITDVEQFEIFKQKCDLTIYSKQILDEFQQSLKEDDLSMMDRAYKYFIVNRTAYNGVGGFSASPVVRRKMSKSVSDFLSTVDNLPNIHDRISKVIIHNTDALQLIKKYDKPDWLYYLDPPYHWSTRTEARYKVDMDKEQQEDFLNAVLDCNHAKVIISGYDCPEYNRLTDNGWYKISFPVKTQNSNREGKVKVETLWANYPISLNNED